jgi:uncharacterized protein
MKKILIIIFLFFASPVLAYYNPGNPSGFVNDFAGMMSGSEISGLEEKLIAFEKETSNEISVVTVNSLEGDYIENFAVELFKEWGIGKKDKDNGVLILVSREDREMRIEVGYGLEGALTDSQSFWIIEKVMKPEFRAENYYNGIDGAVNNIIKALEGEYVPSEDPVASTSNFNYGDFFYLFIFGILWLSSILARSKSWWAGGVIGGIIGIIITIIKGFLFFGLIAIAILIPFGLFFDFVVSKNYQKGKAKGHIPWWIGGGRGGSGGGFGGGGFGGFGGGMSGGGGASGRW